MADCMSMCMPVSLGIIAHRRRIYQELQVSTSNIERSRVRNVPKSKC